MRCFGPSLRGRDEREVDRRLRGRGELDLRLLRGLLQALERHRVVAEVDAFVLLELVGDVVDEALVEVVAAEVGVAVGGLDFEDAVAELEDRDVVRAAAEVVDGHHLVFALAVEAVGEGSGGGLVDDALDGEAGDLAGFLRGRPLRVVEVGGDRDDGLRHLLAEVVFGGLLQLLEDHRRDLLRRVDPLVDLDAGRAAVALDDFVRHGLHLLGHFAVLAAHEALDGEDGVVGVGDGLALGRGADEALAILLEGDDGRRRPAAFRVRDDDGFGAFHHGDDGVRRAEVDTDNLAHCVVL